MICTDSVRDQGFAVIPEVLAEKRIDELAQELSSVDLPRSRAGVRHAMKLAAVAAMARHSRVLGIAQGILGNGAIPFRATLFDKSPAANWLVVWHQDTAMPLRERKETPGSGCIWMTQRQKMGRYASYRELTLWVC